MTLGTLNPQTDSTLPTLLMRLEPDDSQQLAELCGPFDQHLRQIEQRLGVTISNRGNEFKFVGGEEEIKAAKALLEKLYGELGGGGLMTSEALHLALQDSGIDALKKGAEAGFQVIKTRKNRLNPEGSIKINTFARFVNTISILALGQQVLVKTFLAVACAVEAFEQEKISRILLVRPAVEAGEKLGFLPGDLAQKIDPYLRPLYDALYELFGFERVEKLIERGFIEVAPLAYMRGRTLNDAFIILDESQNTTAEQMKMFLTRIGFGSTVVVTGDMTQIDLPSKTQSGLRHAIRVLGAVEGISFTHFGARDVVRHPLVQRIVEAYQIHEDGR